MELEKLRGPHLMLAHTNRDNRMSVLGHATQGINRMLGENTVKIGVVMEGFICLPTLALLDPVRDFLRSLNDRIQPFQCGFDVTHDRNVRRIRVFGRRSGIEPIDIGEENQKVGIEQLGLQPGELIQQRAADVPLGRIGTPQDVAGVVAFLTSPAAAYITGETVILSGGWVID